MSKAIKNHKVNDREIVFKDDFDEVLNVLHKLLVSHYLLTDGIVPTEVEVLAEDVLKKFTEKKEYPFKDGDEYWTIEDNNGNISAVRSCWDDVSEEDYDANPNQLYFSTEEEVIYHILKTNKN